MRPPALPLLLAAIALAAALAPAPAAAQHDDQVAAAGLAELLYWDYARGAYAACQAHVAAALAHGPTGFALAVRYGAGVGAHAAGCAATPAANQSHALTDAAPAAAEGASWRFGPDNVTYHPGTDSGEFDSWVAERREARPDGGVFRVRVALTLTRDSVLLAHHAWWEGVGLDLEAYGELAGARARNLHALQPG